MSWKLNYWKKIISISFYKHFLCYIYKTDHSDYRFLLFRLNEKKKKKKNYPNIAILLFKLKKHLSLNLQYTDRLIEILFLNALKILLNWIFNNLNLFFEYFKNNLDIHFEIISESKSVPFNKNAISCMKYVKKNGKKKLNLHLQKQIMRCVFWNLNYSKKIIWISFHEHFLHFHM